MEEQHTGTGDHMKRYGQIIGVKPEHIEAYERIHEQVWPEVFETIKQCDMRNYTKFRHGTLLFAYFEYVGENFKLDMERMAADPKTKEWWSHTDLMQEPMMERSAKEWWSSMREVFHID